MILLAFVHCGLLDALIALGIGHNRVLAKPAIDLLSEMMQMASRLLPEEMCARLLALPSLVDVASAINRPKGTRLSKEVLSMYGFDNCAESEARNRSMRSSEMLATLAAAVHAVLILNVPNRPQNSSLYSNGTFFVLTIYLKFKSKCFKIGVHMASELLRGTNRPLHQTSVMLAMNGSSRERIVHELKMSMDMQLDDATFKDMLYQRSRVLLVKDWFKWDWDIITELLEGPLTYPTRLSEAMKTKFFQRLSGFFRCDPGNKGYFAQLPWIPDYVPYIRPACQMYTLLLNHPEGVAFLKTDRRGQLLSEIAIALDMEALPEAEIVESHIGALQARMFSPEFCSRRMLREYFTLLGLMSSSKEGLRLLEQSNLFQRLYVMGKMQGHDFLCRLILANLDYSVDGSSRNLLQLWMTDGSKALRLYATCLLRALLRSNEVDFASWGIDVLVTQLYQEEEVARAALSVLEEAAQTQQYLLAMIMKRPQKLVSLPSASQLLLRFLSVPEGLAFLSEIEGWIPNRLQKWRQEEHFSYVHRVEMVLSQGLLQNGVAPSKRKNAGSVPIPVTVPSGRHGQQSKEDQGSYWGLEWLFRLPWNMEVKIIGPSGSGPPSNLTLDTFVDASRLNCSTDLMSTRKNGGVDELQSITIKGIVVDARNLPQPALVNAQQTLQACLFLGTQPVDRRGWTQPAPAGKGGFILSYKSSSTETEGDKGDMGHTTPIPTPDISTVTESDEHKDWCTCRPEQRTSLPYSGTLEPPGEPARWNFALQSGTDNKTKTTNTTGKASRMWLKSVEFVIQLVPQKTCTIPMPSHLYGELAKTIVGCTILKTSGHIPEFVQTVLDPASVPLERRAALWALGHIAATSRGFHLIHECSDHFISAVIKMTTNAPLLSIRGTCFYVLGLISRSPQGRRYLQAHNWLSPQDMHSTVAVPSDIAQLFKAPKEAFAGGPADITEVVSSTLPLPLLRPEWKEVLKCVGNLSSHITQKEAHASLNRLKSTKAELFELPELKMHVLRLMESYNFRLPARQFLHSLFDKAVFTPEVWSTIDASNFDSKQPITRRRNSWNSLTPSVDTTPSSRVASLGAPLQVNGGHVMNVAVSSKAFLRGTMRNALHPHQQSKTKDAHIVFVGAPEAVV